MEIDHLDSASFNYRFGLNTLNDEIMSYAYLHFTFKENFYFYLYPRLVSDGSSFKRFTGVPRPKKRFGFNSGEVDISGVGYENNCYDD